MTSNSRSNDQQKVQAIVETLQQRVVDHLKAHGPQPMEDHQDEGMDGLFDGGSVKSSADQLSRCYFFPLNATSISRIDAIGIHCSL